MIHLLDVNALLALAFDRHDHHARVLRWLAALQSRGVPTLATCAITELGFVRIAPSAKLCGNVADARLALAKIKASRTSQFALLSDALGVDTLPAWATTPIRTTDGHLVALAASHRARLATLDTGIPGALLIP